MITIGRHWHDPKIHVKFDNKGVYLELDKDYFIDLLTDKIGNPTFKFTKKAIKTAITECFLEVQARSETHK